jgi:hypothetical protein
MYVGVNVAAFTRSHACDSMLDLASLPKTCAVFIFVALLVLL